MTLVACGISSIQCERLGLAVGVADFQSVRFSERVSPGSRLQFARVEVRGDPSENFRIFRTSSANGICGRTPLSKRTARCPEAYAHHFNEWRRQSIRAVVLPGLSLRKSAGLLPVNHFRGSHSWGNLAELTDEVTAGKKGSSGLVFSARKWKKQQSNASACRPSSRIPLSFRFRNIPRMQTPAAVSGEGTAKLDMASLTPGGFIYHPFVDFAQQKLTSRPDFSSLLLKEELREMISKDSSARIDNIAFTSPKVRIFRIACIQAGPRTQILTIAGFAREEYDLPIFCAEFVSVLSKNIIVLDLNPIFNTNNNNGYKERYYNELMPMANKYIELLPWGDKLTTESLQFFSPLVLWTKAQNDDVSKFLYPAFQEYLTAWLNVVDSASPSIDPATIAVYQDAQQHYLSWRATKDPGLPLLTKFFGEQMTERFVKEFLFNGLNPEKSFLDYFPEYKLADGGVAKQRSMIGKSFEKRPWNKDGTFLPN